MTIRILDCTLRDGGFCNDWNFGVSGSKTIINGLMEANVDFIELGYLNKKAKDEAGHTRFPKFNNVKTIIPEGERNSKFLLMFDHGSFSVDDVPNCDGTIDGIRVAFHKKDIDAAIKECQLLKDKGYLVFVQPMLAIRYSDEEYIHLIQKTNELEPEAFYIVDSYGTMKQKDLVRLYHLVEHNLKHTIKMGFHPHNYKQMAFANAQTFVEIPTSRDLYIDSSVYGMGRGAGNLNTELILEHMNETFGERYYLKPILSIMDDVVDSFFQKNHWGYSLAYYLSAAKEVHPHYARHLREKRTLPIEMVDDILKMIPSEKQYTYDEEFIEELYDSYMAFGKIFEEHLSEFVDSLKKQPVLLVAPGYSINRNKDALKQFIADRHPIVIGINSSFDDYCTDYVFVSNIRRFKELGTIKSKCIVTSNIPVDSVYLQVSYTKLVNNNTVVKDNSGLMAVKMIINMGLKEVFLAGYDGYDLSSNKNYANPSMDNPMDRYRYAIVNSGMSDVLSQYSKEISIRFVTPSRFEDMIK